MQAINADQINTKLGLDALWTHIFTALAGSVHVDC